MALVTLLYYSAWHVSGGLCINLLEGPDTMASKSVSPSFDILSACTVESVKYNSLSKSDRFGG